MTDGGFRPLAIMLGAQLVLVATLLIWAVQGFPLPDALTGEGRRPAATSQQTTPPAGDGPPAVVAPGATGSPAIPPKPSVDRFDATRAFALLREQVRTYGWRPAGSAALRRLAVRLRSLLPRGRFEPLPGHPKLRNVVGSIPGRRPAIVVGAHYDVEARPKGFVGANDGAAGTAAVVWIARALARQPRRSTDREVRFVLFDGEEEPAGCADFLTCGIRGSRAYAQAHAGDVQRLILLDYIAERRNLSFPREGGSDIDMWEGLRTAATEAGTAALFPDTVSGQILDDHTPFTQRGIPAIDLIDFDYPPRDTLQDDLDKVSARSLDAVGETVLQYVRTLRRAG